MRIALAWVALGAAVLSGCSDGGNAPTDNNQIPTPIAQAAPAGQAAGQPGTLEPAAIPPSPPPIAQEPPGAAVALKVPQGSGFDFYVLSLSWSPAYCASQGSDADPRQCNTAKPLGFIVHGLWPQYERGSPDYCGGSDPTRAEIDSVRDLTPSPGLLRHEWEKHGSCSGLSVRDYYKVMRAARQKVTVPAQFANPQQGFSIPAQTIEQAFIRANPGLNAQSIAAACPQNDFAEIRICLDMALNFRACPEVDRAGCRSQSVSIEPMP